MAFHSALTRYSYVHGCARMDTQRLSRNLSAPSLRSTPRARQRLKTVGSLETPVGAPRVARDGLLEQEAHGADHGDTAVGELLLLHLGEQLRVLRLDAGGVPAEVARHVALAEGA